MDGQDTMTDDSKKLTVSFGNFTCTLDGYDDPVPVLSRVIEQLQTVARDDPSFGSASAADTRKSEPGDARGDFDEADGAASGETNWEMYNVAALDAGLQPAPVPFDQTDMGDTAEDGEWSLPSANPSTVPSADPSANLSAETPLGDTDPKAEATDPGQTVKTLVLAPADKVAEAFETEAESQPDLAETDAVGDEMEPAAGAGVDDAIAAIQRALPEAEAQPVTNAEQQANPLENSPLLLAEEEAAIERMISASRDRDLREPDLAPNNPLARLRDQAQPADALTEPAAPPLALDAPLSATGETAPEEMQEAPLRLSPLTLNAPIPPALSDDDAAVASGIFAETEAEVTDLGEALADQATLATAPDDADLNPNTREFLQALSGDEPEEAPIRLEPSAAVEAEAPPAPEAALPKEPDPADDLRQFAAAMGATSLAEQMEASAAFVTIMNGQKTFTRREIFDHFDELNRDGHVSFEARIKTLSRLLRTGVLERSEDGSFSLSTNARAQYEERARA